MNAAFILFVASFLRCLISVKVGFFALPTKLCLPWSAFDYNHSLPVYGMFSFWLKSTAMQYLFLQQI
jgi:hypothetical protein